MYPHLSKWWGRSSRTVCKLHTDKVKSIILIAELLRFVGGHLAPGYLIILCPVATVLVLKKS